MVDKFVSYTAEEQKAAKKATKKKKATKRKA